jgi:hypothetical protein
MVEGMLSSMKTGAAVRLLGRRFGPDPKKVPNYTGPRYDIYEITAPLRVRNDQLVRTKRYYFDSKAGLLLTTKYYDRTVSPAISVDTRFSDWLTVDGSAFPGRIDRYENGRPIFSFVVGTVSAGPSQDPSSFR